MNDSRVKHPIAVRLARISVVIAFSVGLILSMLQVYRDYLNEEASLDSTVYRILHVAERPATTAVHNLTEDLAREVIQGLLEYPFIVKASIKDDLGIVLAEKSRGTAERDSRTRWITRSIAEEFKTYEIELHPEGVSLDTPGHLIIVVDKDTALGSFFERSILIVGGGVVRNLLLALLLFMAFYWVITKPLVALSKGFSESQDKPDRSRLLKIDSHHTDDEFWQLTETANQYIESNQTQLEEIKNSQRELQALHVFLVDVINSSDMLIIGIDVSAKVTLWNKAAERTLELRSSDVQERNLFQVFPWMEKFRDQVESSLAKGKTFKKSKEVWYLHGQRRLASVSILPLVDSPNGGAVIRVDDVTDLAKIEETIIQSEKMLSVGGLAAGMAHEINNPLAGILQNIQVMKNRFKPDMEKNLLAARESGIEMDGLQAYLDDRQINVMMNNVLESSLQATKIVEQMLTFSQVNRSGKDAYDLPGLIDESIEIARQEHELKTRYGISKVSFVKEYSDAVTKVVCDESKIKQVVFNLIQNSVHAMSEAATLGPNIIIRLNRKNDQVQIEVEDNGPGMEGEVSRKIFEPFFTTKSVGIGTGLGLSISYFIITEMHQGTMKVDSRLGRGTKITINLPLLGGH